MHEALNSELTSRFLVGIDLGTTNCALAYVDTAAPAWSVCDFAIPQLVGAAEVESREVLPSFLYLSAPNEFAAGGLQLPWREPNPTQAVGLFAREHGAAVPGRLIGSAKSWLSHSGVDRTAPLLPWHGAADVERLSPVQASARYLAHIRAAWDHRFSDHPLAHQDVVLTVPASFDEVARELTVQAARDAGLVKVVLVEEPQAAFYAWIDAQGTAWDKHVRPGQTILVCDVGGGTSDFTLIRVRSAAKGKVLFQRVAVGEHLILGGDNLDLALARHVEQRMIDQKLTAGPLPAPLFSSLVRICRVAKETLLGKMPPETVTVNVPGVGSRLIGGSLRVELSRDEVNQVLVEGFLPHVAIDAKPAARRSGFQEFGLPYATDAGITRYLAAFLTAHRATSIEDSKALSPETRAARPDMILFNGGLFESPVLRKRLLEVVEGWFAPAGDGSAPIAPSLATPGGEGSREVISQSGHATSANPHPGPPPAYRGRGEQGGDINALHVNDVETWHLEVLRNDRLDLAVARGAAYYGMVRRGKGVRITGGLAHSYYLGVESGADGAVAALCLLPAGVEEGHGVDLTARTFDLLIRQPAEFPLFYSATRTTDKPEALVPVDPEQLTALPPIRTVLQSGRKTEADRVSVHLHARLTEIGTLEMWCAEVHGDRQWKLQFDVRAASRAEIAKHGGAAESAGFVEENVAAECRELIRATFQKSAGGLTDAPAGIIKRLEHAARQGSQQGVLQDAQQAARQEGSQPTSRKEGSQRAAREDSSLQDPRQDSSQQATGMTRHEWPPSLMRGLWETLIEVDAGRRLSVEHEARWLSLAGFCLRPGYGLAVDDWRVTQTWRQFSAGGMFPKNELCRAEWWILWRRIAGGLTAGQQATLADPLIADWRTWIRKSGSGVKGRSTMFQFGPHESAEVWRLLGSLELLKPSLKAELGQIVLERLPREKVGAVRESLLFCLGRLGARVPVYGPLNALVDAEIVQQWCATVIEMNPADERAIFALVQLARRTGDRYRDISHEVRTKTVEWLVSRRAEPHLVELVREGGTLREEEQRTVFGESLPRGLRIE